MRATGWSWQPSLFLWLSAQRLFCLCCNPPRRHPWGRIKDIQPDPNSQKGLERQNKSKASRKAANYRFLRWSCRFLRGPEHPKQSFHEPVKTFIRERRGALTTGIQSLQKPVPGRGLEDLDKIWAGKWTRGDSFSRLWLKTVRPDVVFRKYPKAVFRASLFSCLLVSSSRI